MGGHGVARWLGIVLVVASVLSTPAVGAAAEPPEVETVSPADLNHGESNQTIRLGGQVPAGETTLTVDLSPLAQVGVDLSNASGRVVRSTPEVASGATVERVEGRTMLRTTLNASEPTGFRLALRLEGLEMSTADTDRLRYDGTLGDRSFRSDPFNLEPPGLPDLRANVESDRLTAGQADASQKLGVAVSDTPPDSPVTVSVDLGALEHGGVGVGRLRADAAAVDGDLAVERVAVEGSTVEMELRSSSTDGGSVLLTLSGVDTRGTGPAGGLRYRMIVDAPAGTKTVTSEPFGIYERGETQTPTQTLVMSPTATRIKTATQADGSGSEIETGSPPGASSGPTGFTALAAGVALAIVMAGLALRGRD